MSQLRIAPGAVADLDEIWSYIAQDDPQAAREMIAAILDRCEGLAEMPRSGRVRNELQKGLRSYPFKSYVIFYQPIDDGIEVVRVIHGSRDLPRQFKT